MSGPKLIGLKGLSGIAPSCLRDSPPWMPEMDLECWTFDMHLSDKDCQWVIWGLKLFLSKIPCMPYCLKNYNIQRQHITGVPYVIDISLMFYLHKCFTCKHSEGEGPTVMNRGGQGGSECVLASSRRWRVTACVDVQLGDSRDIECGGLAPHIKLINHDFVT